MSDPRLLNDLSDAEKSFADILNPTDSEWLSYWRKNPIAALTGDGGWFSLVDDQMVASDVVDAGFGATFDDMVSEIVEYRLHRYLVGREAQRPTVTLNPRRADGSVIDAGFRIETALGEPLSILFESSGGSKQANARNLEYVAGIDIVLDRLAAVGAVLTDAYVDSSKTRHMPVSERRVIDPDADLPVELSGIDRVALRRDILKRMRLIGQAPGASGGNNRKALRIVVDGVDQVPLHSLAAALTGDAHLSAEKFDDSHPTIDESGSAAWDI